MENETVVPFIFYLTLEEALPSTFYTFDRFLKELGFMLIPIKVDQLQTLIAASEQEQIIVISSVMNSRELKMFNEKVRSSLKYILKSKRISFMNLSSFSKLNDSKIHTMNKNYYFLKYPIDARVLSARIARYYQLKSEQNSRWPGGKRAGVNALMA